MKRLLTFLLALLLAGIGAKAQSVDVSSKLLGNAQSNWTGATGTYSAGGAERYQTANYTASDGKVLYQSISGLDNGIYEVTFYAATSSTTGRGFDNVSGTGIAQVFANSTVMDVTVFDQTGCTPSDYEYTLTCEVTNGTLEFGLQNVGTGGNWYVCQGISLVYSGQALNTGDTYYASVADLCQWSISPTPDGTTEKFQRNTWSEEADVSGMKPPFIEYWHGSGNNLDDAVISHKTLTGLTPGLYEVSVFARAFNENSTTAVGEGITFTANGKSVDLTTGTTGMYNGVSAEVYGTYTLVAEVTEAGTLSIGFTIDSETSCDWVAWKNLKVVYDGASLPDLEYVEGIMNADVEAAMKAAVDAYNTSKSTDDYATAVSAIAAAEASVAYYAPIAAIVEALDEAGLAAWNATTNGQAYTARSLTNEDVSAELIASQLAQTTEGSDLSYAMQNTGSWSADQGNGPAAYSTFATETYIGSGEATSGNVLYYTVTGLQPGTYTVTFYAAANMANNVTGDSGEGISMAYANNAATSMTVGTNSAAQITSLDDMTLYTIRCTVGYDGKLEFGIQNVADGGNWFLGAVNSLTLVELTEITETIVQEKVFMQNLYGGDLVSRGKQNGTAADVDFVGTPLTLYSYDGGTTVVIGYADIDLSDENATGAYLGGTNWATANNSLSNAVYFTMVDYTDSEGNTGYQFTSEYGYLYRYDAALTPEASPSSDNTYRLAVNGVKGTNYSDDLQTVWTFVDKDERNSLKAAWVADQKMDVAQKAGLTEITSAEEFDEFVAEQTETSVYSSTLATEAIVTADWTVSGTPGYNADGYAYGVEAYYGNDPGYARLSHEITGLIPGVYKLTLNGLDRNSTPEYSTEMYNEGYTDLSESYLEANGHEINLQPWASEAYWSSYYYPNFMDESSAMFESGSYLNTLYTYVGEDGVLDINIALLVTEYFGWATVKNLNVYYLGELEFGEDKDYDKGDEVEFDDVLYTVVTGENLFVNGGFNEGVTGWTAGSGYTDALASNAVTYTWSGGYNGNPYITLPSSVGAANAATPTQAIEVEPGKSYLFVGYTKGTAPTEGNLRYSALFEMDYNNEGKLAEKNHTEVGDDGGETSYSNTIIQLEWGNGSDELNGWTKTEGVFTVPTADEESTYGTYSYVGMRMNWSTGSYDGFQLYEVEPVMDEVEWTLTTAQWGTLILPFDASIPDTDDEGNAITWTAYSCDGLDSDGETLSLTTVDDGLAANTPYILSGDAGTYTFKGTPVAATTLTSGLLTGTLVNMVQTDFTQDGTEYVLQNHDGAGEGGVAFYPIIKDESENVTLAAYHCYLKLDENTNPSGARVYISFPGSGDATGIEAVEGTEVEANGAIYDLSGRKVSKAVKGVYIMNGKKVMVK